MNGLAIQYFVGLVFIGLGIDQTPNWFKIGFGAILVLTAIFGLTVLK
jgi:hypothetical protein